MLARIIEKHGIATVGISLVRLQTEKVRPPRYLFVPFPFGRALGKPNDPAFQQQVIDAALALLQRPERAKPVLEDFPLELEVEPGGAEPLACALVLPPRPVEVTPSKLGEAVIHEIAQLRPAYEGSRQKLGRTMVGSSRILPQELEQAVRYLVAYLAEQELATPQKPSDIGLTQYLRWCADDLKVFYQEAALFMQQEGSWSNRQLQDWLWQQTALGSLIRAVRNKISEQSNPTDKAIAFGLIPRLYH